MNNPPSSSFTFLPPNPNPNPNPNFFHQQHHHHHHHQPPFSYQSTATTTAAAVAIPPPPPPPPGLPTTLSTLKHLIQLSQSTIQSISTLFHLNNPTATTTSLSTCPFNPNHRLPPPSLFRHYLLCPSSPATIDLTLLESLHYPTSFRSSDELISEIKPFHQTLNNPDTDADLCFSLDEYQTSLASNLYYRDCPGVVTFPDDQDNASPMLTLPVVLSAECANFNGGMDVMDIGGVSSDSVGNLLPSELWSVRNEIAAWNDYPTRYSSRVLRLILALYTCGSCDLKDWLVSSSPRYGIVIDLPMGDHIHLLFRVCLKAIIREALWSMGFLSRGEENGCKDIGCPVLVRVLVWLASQLSVLYGEANGRLFAVEMFKQSLLLASSSSLMFSDEKRGGRVCPGLGTVDDKGEECLKESSTKQEKTTWVIFVSQVAAAAAALHERALLETKIKAIRYMRPLTNYQRVAEHGFESQKADEQRQKRSNYRPILEHDGILSQRERDKETNRMKSREELLAEERDYKRRRTSYRGKKIKRNTTHVMRDIIEEYMEEIKQAGGIGCFVKGTGTGMHASEPFALRGVSTDTEAKMSAPTSSEVHNGTEQGSKQLDSENKIRSTRVKDESPERNMRQRYDSYSDTGHLEPYSGDRNRHDREYYRNDDGQRSITGSYEKLDRDPRDGNKVNRKYLPPSPDRGHSRSREQSHRSNRMHKTVDHKDSYERKPHRKGRSDSVVHHEFEDRYDPSGS